jgi:hypothetical protein
MTPSPETKTMTEKLDSVPLKACAGCGQLYPLNGNGHMCKPTPAADEVGADSVDLESTFGPILKDKFPDYDSLTRFHAAYALAEAAIAAMQARSAEPAGEEPVAWNDLGAERYVRDFIIHGEVSTRLLEPWEQSHQDAGHIDMAERRGYIHVGRDVACTITVTDHGRRIAALLNRPATPTNPERLVDGWRSIDSAPKDGTEVILFGLYPENDEGLPTNRVTAGFWLEPEPPIIGDCGGECRCPEYGEAVPAHWCTMHGGSSSGWMSTDGGFTTEWPPTHWMPLPAAPLKEGEGE